MKNRIKLEIIMETSVYRTKKVSDMDYINMYRTGKRIEEVMKSGETTIPSGKSIFEIISEFVTGIADCVLKNKNHRAVIVNVLYKEDSGVWRKLLQFDSTMIRAYHLIKDVELAQNIHDKLVTKQPDGQPPAGRLYEQASEMSACSITAGIDKTSPLILIGENAIIRYRYSNRFKTHIPTLEFVSRLDMIKEFKFSIKELAAQDESYWDLVRAYVRYEYPYNKSQYPVMVKINKKEVYLGEDCYINGDPDNKRIIYRIFATEDGKYAMVSDKIVGHAPKIIKINKDF